MSCSDELAVHSCPLCIQKRVAKVASGLFYCWSVLCNNAIATSGGFRVGGARGKTKKGAL